MIALSLLFAACTAPIDSGDSGDSGDTGDTAPPLHTASECGLHEDLPEDWNYREAVGAGIDLIVVREYTGMGAGFTNMYALRGWALARGDELICLDDEDALLYVTGHHNWHDEATATLEDERQRLVVDYEHSDPDDYTSDFVWALELTGLDVDDDDVRWGPLPLELIGGVEWY